MELQDAERVKGGWLVDRRIALPTLAGLFVQSVLIAIGVGVAYANLQSNISDNGESTQFNLKRIEALEQKVHAYDTTIARLEERIISLNVGVIEIKELIREVRNFQQKRSEIGPILPLDGPPSR